MDQALVEFDITQLGAIIADMVIACLDAGAPPDPEETPDEQDHRPAPVTAGLYLHPAVNAGSSAQPSGEHGSTIQSDAQSPLARLERGADPPARPRSRAVRGDSEQPGGFQDASQRCSNGPGR